jgi:superfamily I DNA/RNA helicase
MQPTHEQLPIINYEGRHLVVMAFAGCGKTSTLVQFALKNSHLKMLYLAYNRAIRDEGAEKFPRNVVCKTSHQLAWPEFGSRLQHKLGNTRLTDIGDLLETRNWKMIRAVQATVNAFLSSASTQIELSHTNGCMRPDELASVNEGFLREVVNGSQQVWEAMIDPDNDLQAPHDAYLKQFQLSNPSLPFDVILFDEAQDANPVTAALVRRQKCRRIFVGDRWQQIYRWRGAENSLDMEIDAGADVMHLTQSFRFGRVIAGAANVILRNQGEIRSLIGSGPPDQVYTTVPQGASRYTVLNRTVAGVIQSAISEVERGKIIFWNGGIEAYQISDIEDLHYLKEGEREKVGNRRLLKEFPSYAAYEDAAKETKDPDMQRLVKILKEHMNIPRLLASLRKNIALEPEDADVIVSTVHRSKGLEWPMVILENDFPDIFEQDPLKMSPEQRVDELNLLYVAVTRAKNKLVINELVQELVLKTHAEARKARAAVS